MNFRRRISILLILAACSASLSLPSMVVAQDIQKRTYSADFNAVWIAARKQLSDAGHTVRTQDKEAGLIETTWTVLKERGVFARGWRVRQSIQVEKISDAETSVSIRMFFQNQSGRDPWTNTSASNNYTPKLTEEFFKYIESALPR